MPGLLGRWGAAGLSGHTAEHSWQAYAGQALTAIVSKHNSREAAKQYCKVMPTGRP